MYVRKSFSEKGELRRQNRGETPSTSIALREKGNVEGKELQRGNHVYQEKGLQGISQKISKIGADT